MAAFITTLLSIISLHNEYYEKVSKQFGMHNDSQESHFTAKYFAIETMIFQTANQHPVKTYQWLGPRLSMKY